MTGLPAYFLTFGQNHDTEKRHKRIASLLAVPRVALIWIAIIYSRNVHIRVTLAIVAASIYALEILFTYVRAKKRNINPNIMTSSAKFLYYGAHFSIINFALDMCSSGIKTLRIQHILLIIANTVTVFIIVIGLFIVDPYQRAWNCYNPRERRVTDLKRGMCPQWEKYYGPYRHRSSSNSGDINLVCRDEFGGPVYNSACTLGTVDTSLPFFWQLATLVASISFAVSLTLVRSKISEISYKK